MQQGTGNLEEDYRESRNPKTGRNAKQEQEDKRKRSPLHLQQIKCLDKKYSIILSEIFIGKKKRSYEKPDTSHRATCVLTLILLTWKIR